MWRRMNFFTFLIKREVSPLRLLQSSFLSRMASTRANGLARDKFSSAFYSNHDVIHFCEHRYSTTTSDSDAMSNTTDSGLENRQEKLRKSRTSLKRNAHWEKMLEELIRYRNMYGDTLVPAEFSKNPQLGTWGESKIETVQLYVLQL